MEDLEKRGKALICLIINAYIVSTVTHLHVDSLPGTDCQTEPDLNNYVCFT